MMPSASSVFLLLTEIVGRERVSIVNWSIGRLPHREKVKMQYAQINKPRSVFSAEHSSGFHSWSASRKLTGKSSQLGEILIGKHC
jgi:hypothetical protein